MVYCAAFDCNANSSETRVTCRWLKFPTKHSKLCSLREFLFRLRSEKMTALGYPGAKISLKEDVVPTVGTNTGDVGSR